MRETFSFDTQHIGLLIVAVTLIYILSCIHLDGVHTEQGPRPAPRVSFQREMAADAL